MPNNFACRLIAAHYGNPEETTEFWDDLDEGLWSPTNERPAREPVDRAEGGRSGYRATRLPQDQDDLEEEGRWR